MELLDIYNNIQNPIDDPNIISKLVDIYGDNSTLATNLYDKIIDQHKAGKVTGKYYPELQRLFEIGLFNKWKNEVLSMTQEEFIELHKKGVYPENFPKLRNYLKTMPKIRSIEDLNHYKYGHEVPTEIKDLFEDYCWNSLGWGTGWTHVSSKELYANKTEQMPIEHRLYLNVDSTAIHKIAIEFIDKCEDMGMPYYLKFNLMANRDDVMVIYSDTKHLTMFIEILNKIKQENKDLEGAFHEPPMLSGKIYDWLGYGSEPKEKKSFNRKRSDAIEEGISKTSREWIKDHIIRMISFRGSFVHFFEYITVAMVETKLAELKSTYRYYDDCSKSDIKGYDPNYALSKIGLKQIDLGSVEFKDYLYKKLIKNMEDRIISFCEDPDYKFKMDIPVREGKTIIFNQYDIDKAIKKIVPKIKDNDPDFLISVKDNILEESKKAGIDKNKYCFDTDTVYQLINSNGSSVKADIPDKNESLTRISTNAKQEVVEPIKVIKKRDMLVHTNYVPSHKLLDEVHYLLENDFDSVLSYLYNNMSSIRILLPEVMKSNMRLANIFVDDVALKHPEIQRIYEDALVKIEDSNIKRDL